MIAVILLLCAVKLHFSDAVAEKNRVCASNHEVECFMPPDYLNSSDPVRIEVCVGKKLLISLQHLSDNPVCKLIRGTEPVLAANGSHSVVLPPLSEADSGEYTLMCETSSEIWSSMVVSLRVVRKLPTKPRLLLERVEDKWSSPYFACISEGCPKPTIEWSGSTEGKNGPSNSEKSKSTISSVIYHNAGAMCCASNVEGQECSQLYDYDLETDIMKLDEVSNITICPNQPLLLRCRIQGDFLPFPEWENDGITLDASSLACPSKVKEICIKNDHHLKSIMTYLFIESAGVNHSGTYTCRDSQNKTKSVYVNVQAEGFISVHLDKSKIIPVKNAPSSCLEASVSYHPVLQHCYWEAPDNSVTKCVKENWVTQHSTVKLCDPLKSGDYKLHLEAGGHKETKTILVCVVDNPKLNFRTNELFNTFETVTLVPANYTWMSCSAANDSSCETESLWNEIPGASHTVTDVSCNKTIQSSLRRELVDGHHLRFCLTNAFGSWCETTFSVYQPRLLQASAVPPNKDDGSLTFLKVGSFLLLLALAIMSIMLLYFVKKKKPQYQPQLQMIQMVGPSDNDYIYINFKDFQYDTKWEFPRENLELGEELGSGAFGMVVQATAYGIDKPGVPQQVAVKMLKEKHHAVEKEALMSELKMLTHIGHHDNIVNLLGACTDSGPTYLIFQYCCYGDLLNYLKKNRERYHKSLTDAFNKDRFSSLYHNVQTTRSKSMLQDNYVHMYPLATRGQEDIALLPLDSVNMDGIEDPTICDNLEDDQSDDLQTLTFDDLLSVSFQVAKGMEFLSSRNCIHRDLAARNVLVTKGRLVKICDFGLARDIDNDSNYVVRGNVRLPVKWMAPESTFQGIYTMKSDVWAYGILLWEIFSLGVTPYPGMKVDQTFYSMIERGFKMECPYYATESVYRIMCNCWALEPCSRPSFSELVSFMHDQLTDIEEKLYHNMLHWTSSDYQNTSATTEITALAKRNESKVNNVYCRTHLNEERKEEPCNSDAAAAEEELLKPSDDAR